MPPLDKTFWNIKTYIESGSPDIARYVESLSPSERISLKSAPDEDPQFQGIVLAVELANTSRQHPFSAKNLLKYKAIIRKLFTDVVTIAVLQDQLDHYVAMEKKWRDWVK